MTHAQISRFSMGGYSLTGDTTPPTAPGSPTASAPSGTQINLSWPAATDNVGVTSYQLERCQGVSCTSFVLIASPTTTSYLDTGLTAPVTVIRSGPRMPWAMSAPIRPSSRRPRSPPPPTAPRCLPMPSIGPITQTWGPTMLGAIPAERPAKSSRNACCLPRLVLNTIGTPGPRRRINGASLPLEHSPALKGLTSGAVWNVGPTHRESVSLPRFDQWHEQGRLRASTRGSATISVTIPLSSGDQGMWAAVNVKAPRCDSIV